jgi:GGDEF domain-containing protein
MYFKERFEKDLLFIDELTGIFNRRFFERILPNIFKKCESSVFIIIDVDNFKNLNDRYGHRNGDLFLKKIGEILKKFFYNENEFPFILKMQINLKNFLKGLMKVYII